MSYTAVNDDEYTQAADIINDYIKEIGFKFNVTKDDINSVREKFVNKYDYKKLKDLSGEALLSRVFYKTGVNKDALCYLLEFDNKLAACFGGIQGGSQFKFGLFKKRETEKWLTGTPGKSQELTDDEAVELGENIVNALIKGAEIIEKAELNSLADYEKMDDDLNGEIGTYYKLQWFHKYYGIMFPEKLSCYHNTDFQRHILRCFGINPSEKYYGRSGQIAMIQNKAKLLYAEFYQATYKKFGEIKNFVRIDTSDGKKSYAEEWKKTSVIGLGFKFPGTLEGYFTEKEVNEDAIRDILIKKCQQNEKTASCKVCEIECFCKTNANTIFVAMEGEKLIAFVDKIGPYFYYGNAETPHLKPGTWHLNFADGETLPAKDKCKDKSCSLLDDNENLKFLYKKYYFSDKETQLDEISYDDKDPVETNKCLFRKWMNEQGFPVNTIDSYVSYIKNTHLSEDNDRCVFYTTESEEVEKAINNLDNEDKKSAVRKYLEYLSDTKKDCMPLKFKTKFKPTNDYDRNRIVFGAPGTGKSNRLKEDCDTLIKNTNGTYERVTFHPDYSYSQFLGTYKPVMDVDGRSIRYDFVPGPFMRVYVDALKSGRTDEPQPHLLLIEEINRAKVAAVFGDIFQLLDRDDDGVSEYEIQASEDIRRYLAMELGGSADNYKMIRIPNNMFIWATMNSADQGVFPMDTAFKRRWNFEYLGINENEKEIQGKGKITLPVTSNEQIEIEWNKLRKAINDKMSSQDFKINEDKLMGPFFLSKKVIESADEKKFKDAFKSKVIMYLYEDAVKQGKHRFFEGCDSSKYSSVCDAFDKKGIAIFGETFKETFYDKK